MNKTYLLTGATGFLGKVILNFLSNQENLVLTLNDKIGRVDISQPFALDSNLKIDAVIHAAGRAHVVPKTERERQAFYNINLQGTKNLCSALDNIEVKPKAFVFISTVAVYGVDSGENILESHPLNGKSPYAKSKILAETFLQSWCEKNEILLTILRLPLLIGPQPQGNLKAMISGIKTGMYFSISKSDARKSMVWAEDIAEIIPSLINKKGIFNLTDGYHPSFKELESEISINLKKGMPFAIPFFVAALIGRVGDIVKIGPINSEKIKKIISTLTFDDSNAQREFNWKPNFVLEKIKEIL